MQRERDRLAGLNTAGFISGYRGSPLGGLDQQFWRAKKQLGDADIVFQPGLNEELAATARWGSQQTELSAKASTTASSSVWYGRARASIARATCSATPTSPARRSMAACWP